MLKNFNKFDRRLLSAAAILLLLFSYLLCEDSLIMGYAITRGDLVARISSTTEDVRLKYSSDFRWINASHSEIHMGDSIFTGPHSVAKIRMADNSILEIKENSMITFSQVGSQMIINLKSGQVTGESSNVQIVRSDPIAATPDAEQRGLNPSSQVTRIEMPRPVIISPDVFEQRKVEIGVDGNFQSAPKVAVKWTYVKPLTEFELQIATDPNFKTIERSEITKHNEYLTPDLKEGAHFFRVRENPAESPGAVWSKVAQVNLMFERPVLSDIFGAPRLKVPRKRFVIGAVEPAIIEWDPISGAKQYLVELDTTNSGFRNVQKINTIDTRLVLKNLMPGTFSYRVTALMPDNKITPTSRPGIGDAVVLPPNPNPVEKVEYLAKDDTDKGPPRQFNVSWSPTPETSNYIIQLSDNLNFENATQFTADKTNYSLQVPKSGTYYWRVQSQARNGKPLTEYSRYEQINYTIHDPLNPPNLLQPHDQWTLFFQATKENPFWMTWSGVPHGKTYVLQIAKDPEFKKVVLEKHLAKLNYLVSEKIAEGQLYWRVRVEAEGRRSGWSKPRQMSIFAGRAARGN